MCEMQSYGQQWANLSAFTPGSTSYNQALQAITDQVTTAGVAIGRMNGSAIGRIRTNERIFAPSGDVTDYSGGGNHPSPTAIASWDLSAWEMRQYELDPNTGDLDYGYFTMAPVTNTPVSSANYLGDPNTTSPGTEDNNQSIDFEFNGTTVFNLVINSAANPDALIKNDANCAALIDWAFKNQATVLNENHVMPAAFPGTSTPMLAGSALLSLDYAHTLDFNWQANTTYHPHTSTSYTATGNYENDRNIRHKLSLNTCQGCHSSETKTLFTQVRPLGYGESADYIGAIPGYESDYTAADPLKADVRFTSNIGTTPVKHGTVVQQDPNYSLQSLADNRYFVKVSPLLRKKLFWARRSPNV